MQEQKPDALAAMRFIATPPPPFRPWAQVAPGDIALELVARDAPFLMMIAFLRTAPLAALVLDDTSRVLFMNVGAERYWKLRTWEAQGLFLGDVMKLDEEGKKSMRREHAALLAPDGRATVFYEHFHNGSERVSMLQFPFAEAAGRLLGCFVLPANGGGTPDPRLGY